jgi:hypothetical protein
MEYNESSVNGWVAWEAIGDPLFGHVRALLLECPSLRALPFILFADSVTARPPLSLLKIFAHLHVMREARRLHPIDVSWARSFRTFSTGLCDSRTDQTEIASEA